MNGVSLSLAIFLSLATGIANASFYGDTISGQLSDPWTTQLFDSDTALVGDGDEVTGSVSQRWNPLWDPGTNTLTLVATDGFTIPPYYDSYATFDAVVPIPASLPLMLSALLALIALQGRGARGT